MKVNIIIPSFSLHQGWCVEQMELRLYIDSDTYVFFIEQKQKRI